VHAISTPARPNNLSNQARPNKPETEITLISIFKMITEMTAKMATIEGHVRHLQSTVNSNANQPRNGAQLHNRNENNQDNDPPSTFCWYHEKYAEKALKCGGNCNFNEARQTQGN
jgi:hypothetical protein